jgi:hypothetical protein
MHTKQIAYVGYVGCVGFSQPRVTSAGNPSEPAFVYHSLPSIFTWEPVRSHQAKAAKHNIVVRKQQKIWRLRAEGGQQLFGHGFQGEVDAARLNPIK